MAMASSWTDWRRPQSHNSDAWELQSTAVGQIRAVLCPLSGYLEASAMSLLLASPGSFLCV